jgi:hypothetical protein
MISRFCGYLVGGLFLILPGCGRSTVLMTPQNATLTEESPLETTVARTRTEESEPAPFTFPDDSGGVLLAKVLPPKDVESAILQRPHAPHRALDSSFDKPPTLALPPSYVALPRLADDGSRSSLRPRLVADESLGAFPASLPLPQTPALPDMERIRVPSPDVNRPIPLPILAQPISDRASLDDPTLDASTAAALAAPIPPRSNKTPFLKQTLPDPYDHRRTDIATAEESKEFPLDSPQTPRR